MEVNQNAEILKTARNYIGYIDDEVFNQELLTTLNAIIGMAAQLGVVPTNVSEISSATTWKDVIKDEILINDKTKYIGSLFKEYVLLKVKLVFDPPPANSKEILESLATELETRITYI